MSLIKLLQEASTLDLDLLKKAIQKDKRIAPILKKNFSIDDIEDKNAFLSTLKFFVLNNPNVRQFVNSRDGVRYVDNWWFKNIRSTTVKDIDQNRLDELRTFVQDLFKDHKQVVDRAMSATLRKELSDWVNGNGRNFYLSRLAQKELKSLDGVRKKNKIRVYRGVLFNEYDLKSKSNYDGSLSVGNGMKFLSAIRKDGKIVDLEWDRPSSWTTSFEVAERFAKYRAATSHFDGMMGFFDRAINARQIDGALGFVMSTLADPDDVLLDTNVFLPNIAMNHGGEGEVILSPGEYTCRIVKKYTEQGEVKTEKGEYSEHESFAQALSEIESFLKRHPLPDLKLDGPSYSITELKILKDDPKLFKQLALNSTTTELMHIMDKLTEFYKEFIVPLKAEDISHEREASDAERGEKISLLRQIKKHFESTVRHPNKSGTRVKYHELSSEEHRTKHTPYDTRTLESMLLGSFNSSDKAHRQGGEHLKSLAQAVGSPIESPRPEMLGKEKRTAVIDKTLNAFFDKLGIDTPEEKVQSLITILSKVYRNMRLLGELKEIYAMMNSKKDE